MHTIHLPTCARMPHRGSRIEGGRAMHYLLFYEVGEDYVAKRAQFRAAHLEKAWAATARGELVLAGALANPVDGAVLLFKGDSPSVARSEERRVGKECRSRLAADNLA